MMSSRSQDVRRLREIKRKRRPEKFRSSKKSTLSSLALCELFTGKNTEPYIATYLFALMKYSSKPNPREKGTWIFKHPPLSSRTFASFRQKCHSKYTLRKNPPDFQKNFHDSDDVSRCVSFHVMTLKLMPFPCELSQPLPFDVLF